MPAAIIGSVTPVEVNRAAEPRAPGDAVGNAVDGVVVGRLNDRLMASVDTGIVKSAIGVM